MNDDVRLKAAYQRLTSGGWLDDLTKRCQLAVDTQFRTPALRTDIHVAMRHTYGAIRYNNWYVNGWSEEDGVEDVEMDLAYDMLLFTLRTDVYKALIEALHV